MNQKELESIILAGEDSQHQFKVYLQRAESLAQEMVAFSNSKGGQLIIGVADDGQLVGLKKQDVARLNQLISNAATQNVRPPISVITENIVCTNGIPTLSTSNFSSIVFSHNKFGILTTQQQLGWLIYAQFRDKKA